MSQICYYNDKRFETFHECFEDCVVSKIDKLFEINLSYYVYEKDIVYSLHMNVMKHENNLYKLKNICFQEESVEYRYHNVCYSKKGEYAVYDFNTDTFMEDVFLVDKYADCSDGYLTEKLEYMFTECPDILPALVDE